MAKAARCAGATVVAVGVVVLVILAVSDDPLWIIGLLVLLPVWVLTLAAIWTIDFAYRTWRIWRSPSGGG
jgi:hypothetical protein